MTVAVQLTQLSLSAAFSATLEDLGQTASQLPGQVKLGDGILPALSAPLTNGTANLQANMVYASKLTIGAGANADIDLNSGSILSVVNLTATFTKIKQVIVIIDSPDGTKKVRVGPQNVTNGCQLWFGGTGATCYEEVVEWTVKTNRYGGWTVTPSTGDILRVNNPGAGSVDVFVILVGLS